MDFEGKKCSTCKDRNSCEDVYQKLGHSDAPSIAWKVIFAFVLPLIIFMASLFVFERIMAGLIDSRELTILAGFVAALIITAVFCFVVKVIKKQAGIKF